MPGKVNKRQISDVDDIETSQSKQNRRSNSLISQNQSFEELINIDKPDHEQYKVTLNSGQRCDASKLSPNSLVYRPARIVVLSKNGGNTYNVRNQDIHKSGGSGADWNLDASLISTQCWSADQYTKSEKITMTAMASKLKEEVGDCICKVEFYKLPDASEMSKLIREGSKLIEESEGSETEKNRMFKKLYERSQVGEYRVMRGYICRSEDQEAQETETGMLKFIDAEAMAEGKFAIRQINLRNIQALTFKLKHYELK